MELCYFDNNSTTELDQQVFQAMLPYLRESYGNASSLQHALGRHANQAVETARHQVATLLHVEPKEILFTTGATESLNMAIQGITARYASKGQHIVTCQTEHHAVLSVCQAMERTKSAEVTYLPVNRAGQIDLQALREAIRPDTILVSIMAANNETGILHPIGEIAEICQQNDVLFLCDATQWVGKLPLNLTDIPIDLLCLSAHKMHGPKGIGALFIRRRSKPIQVEPLLYGGQQELGQRPGTYPVHQIVGLGVAAQLAAQDQNHSPRIRDYFEQRIREEIEEIEIHGYDTRRLPNTSNVHFKHVPASELMTKLPAIALSAGAACVSGSRAPSHVLTAMGIAETSALSSLRFSFSPRNTVEEIDIAIPKIKQAVQRIRSQSPIWQMFKEGLI